MKSHAGICCTSCHWATSHRRTSTGTSMALMASNAFDSGILRPTITSFEAQPVVANLCGTLRPKPLKPPVTRTFWYAFGTGFCGSSRTVPRVSERTRHQRGVQTLLATQATEEVPQLAARAATGAALRRSPMIEAYRRLLFSTNKSSKSVARNCVSARSKTITSPMRFSVNRRQPWGCCTGAHA